MKNMNKRKGISLIVLVITILVMLILSGVVIVSLSKNNPIEKAKEATFKQDLISIGEELEMFITNQLAQNSMFNKETLFATKNSCTFNTNTNYKNIYDIITTLKGTKYKNQIEIKRGELYYKTPDKKEIAWLRDLGIHYTGIVTGTVIIEGDTLVGVSDDYVNTGVLVIPNTVKKINQGAFANCVDIYEVELPEGITEIPDNCFNSCTNLVRVKIPNSVTRIGINAFRSCTNLATVNMPKNLVTIDEGGFIYCKKLPSVVFGNNLKTIGMKAFKDCLSLTSVTLNQGLSEMSRECFSNTGLLDVIVPESVKHIGPNSFYFCQNLKTLKVMGKNTVVDYSPVRACPNIQSFVIADGNIYNQTENNILYKDNKTYLISAPSNLTEIVVPDTVITIGEEAFIDSSKLVKLTLGNNVKTIKQRAFEGCNVLQSLIIPKSVTNIEKRTLERCNSLTALQIDINNPKYVAEDGIIFEKNNLGEKIKVISSANVNTNYKLPDTVTQTEADCFAACKKLTNIDLNKLVSLNTQSFRDCTGITEITIPGTCKVVDWGAFTSALNLNKITFAEGVQDIRGAVLRNCENLVEISIPSTVYAIGGDIFSNSNKIAKITFPNGNSKFSTDGKCIYENIPGGLKLKAAGGLGTEVRIKEGVTEIAGYSLASNRVVEKIILPNTVKKIEAFAFTWSDNLKEVMLPSSVTEIGNETFENCPKLNRIIIDKPEGSISGAPWGATQGMKAVIWK